MASRNLRLAELASNVDISGAYTQASGIPVYNTAAQLPLVGNEVGDMGFVDSNDKLYIYSGEGWYQVAIINQTPTITTGPDASYSLEYGSSPLVLTLAASDPEGFPITWGYSVTTGSIGSTATVEQVDNVFTITPSASGLANTFSITFTVTDGSSFATAVSSFTIANFEIAMSPLQGTYSATSGALSGALQGNGDYNLTGVAPSLATGGQLYTQPFTEKAYFEIVITSGTYPMMGFHTTSTSNYNLTDGTNGLIYYNNNHYKVGAAITSTGVSGNWSGGDVLQFAIDPSTRTMYYSKNDSATIYSHTLAVGDGQIWFSFGSGSGSTTYDLTLRSKDNVQYKSSFESKTGIQFISTGVWA